LTKRSVRELDNAVRATTNWIDDLMLRLGWHDRDNVYAALIAALHALRDWLPRDEAIYIGACFPPLLRGLYYEGWHAVGHVTAKSRRAFLERIQDGVHREPGIDAEQVVPCLPFSRPGCHQPNSRTQKLPPQKNCMGFGRVERRTQEYERLSSTQARCVPDNPCFSLW
jgi:uncharacterized protein (DUF2267 family)